jgi:hypothetical protein
MWLNEGFATYFDALYTESRDGQAAFLQRIRNFQRLYIDNIPVEGRFPLYDPKVLFGATVYFKGASVLHMLRRILGDEAFFSLMRDWATLFAFGNVSTDDLRVLASSHHRESLDWFFDQWVYRRGHPELEVAWVDLGEDDGERTVEILVRQAQLESPFRLPLDVVVHTVAGEVEATLEVTRALSRFRVTVPAEVASVSFDPLSWQLMELETVSPHLLLRAGAVGAAGEGISDVLVVGTPSGPQVGRPGDRRLDVRAGEPLDLLVLAPPGRTSARYVVYCIFEEATGGHLTILPRGLGASVVAPPFAGGTPSVLFNNLGRRGLVGQPRLLAGPAPTLAHRKPAGLGPGDLTIFGLIQDRYSLSPLGLSLTNAIYLHTSP